MHLPDVSSCREQGEGQQCRCTGTPSCCRALRQLLWLCGCSYALTIASRWPASRRCKPAGRSPRWLRRGRSQQCFWLIVVKTSRRLRQLILAMRRQLQLDVIDQPLVATPTHGSSGPCAGLARAAEGSGSSHEVAPCWRNMKPRSEMLLEVTVYCGKVRDQRGCLTATEHSL